MNKQMYKASKMVIRDEVKNLYRLMVTDKPHNVNKLSCWSSWTV